MIATNKCLKEWNATIEALGQGKQTILIRSYGTTLKGFLLYPSVSYAKKDDYLDGFQLKYQSFVENHAFPEKEDDKFSIKYYAKVVNIVEISPSAIGRYKNKYIWTSRHVRDYLKGKKAKIWVLRVYKLNKPYFDKPTKGVIKYAKLKEEVSLKGMEPVLTDAEFNKIIRDL